MYSKMREDQKALEDAAISQIGRLLAAKRWVKTTKADRSAVARQLNAIRWSKQGRAKARKARREVAK